MTELFEINYIVGDDKPELGFVSLNLSIKPQLGFILIFGMTIFTILIFKGIKK